MATSIILYNLVIIFLIIAVGFISGRMKWVGESLIETGTQLVLQVTIPCSIMSSMIREFDADLLHDAAIGFVLGAVVLCASVGFAYFVSGKIFSIENHRRGSWVMCAATANTAFMGYPLVQAIFGDEGLFIAGITNAAFFIVQYVVLVRVMCKFSNESQKMRWRDIIFSNGNIGIAIGLVVFLLQLQLPQALTAVISSFAAVTTPLSMFLIGLSLAQGSILHVFKDKDVLTCTLTKLIVLPILILLVLKVMPFHDGSLVPGTMLLMLAMPSAALSLIFSQQFGGDVRFASETISLTSLCCMVSIPLIMLLL